MSKKNIIVVVCPERGAGNGQEALELDIRQSPTLLDAYG